MTAEYAVVKMQSLLLFPTLWKTALISEKYIGKREEEKRGEKKGGEERRGERSGEGI